MRIVFDISYIQGRRAGIGRFSEELLKGLLTADRENSYILHGWSFSVDTEGLRSLTGHDVHLDARRIPGPLKRLYWNRLRRPFLEHLIGDFDVFHSSDPLLPPTRRKTIATVHDLAYRLFPQFFAQHVLDLDPFIRRSLSRADAVIVPSESTRNDLLKMMRIGTDKVSVIRPPANPLFSPLGDEATDAAVMKKYALDFPYILFVGTIEPRKNILSLVRAYEILRERLPGGPHLVLAGKRGLLSGPSVEAIEGSPASPWIRWLEYVSDTDLAALYRRSEFFVYPSFYEGYGLPVVEAMASGRAVIASNTSSMAEIGASAVKLVDPNDTGNMADALCLLAADGKIREELSRLSLLRASELSGEVPARRLIAIYGSLA